MLCLKHLWHRERKAFAAKAAIPGPVSLLPQDVLFVNILTIFLIYVVTRDISDAL